MNKHIVKPTLSVLFAAFALIFSILAFVAMNGSMAWLVGNDTVRTNGLSVYVSKGNADDIIVTCYGVTKIEELESGRRYTSDRSILYTSDPDLIPEDATILAEMPRYDSAQIDDGEHKPAVLVCLTFPSIAAAKAYTIQAVGTGVDYSSENFWTVNGFWTTNNYLSTAIQFREVSGVSDLGSTLTATANNNLYRFIDATYSRASDTFALTTASETISLPAKAADAVTVYYIMEYNVPVVDYICRRRDTMDVDASYFANITLVLSEVES